MKGLVRDRYKDGLDGLLSDRKGLYKDGDELVDCVGMTGVVV